MTTALPLLKISASSYRKVNFTPFLAPPAVGKQLFFNQLPALPKSHPVKSCLTAKINDIPANKRQLNTVFQDYALFPNMNVFDNVAFGLVVHNTKKEEIQLGFMML